MINSVKTAIGKAVRPFSRARRLSQAGQGGGGGFANTGEEWANPYKPGGLLLGRSLHDPSFAVGVPASAHEITIAGTRGGKGRSVLMPEALTWPGSAVIFGTKPAIVSVTLAARGNGGARVRKGLGQKTYVMAPVGLPDSLHGSIRPARFNPFSIVDPRSPLVREQCGVLAEALVVGTSEKNAFFDNNARDLIRGGIAHVCTDPRFEWRRNPGSLRELLLQPLDDLILDLRGNHMAGGLPRKAGDFLAALPERTASDVLGTAHESTSWLDSEIASASLAANDFDLARIGDEPMTVYLYIPEAYLGEHKRFVRLLANTTMFVATCGGRVRVPTLLQIDEAHACGYSKAIEDSFAFGAGHNFTAHLVYQNVGQIKSLYPANWQTFIANAGVTRIFSARDVETAEFGVSMLGQHVLKERGPDGRERVVGRAPLRDVPEFMHEISVESGRCIVFRGGEPPFLLKKINYDDGTFFRRDQYGPDPDYPKS